MTDRDLVAKKLAFVETCVQQIRTLGHPDQIDKDVREERFVEHTLQLAIQACLDAAPHVVSDLRLGEPATNRDLFDLLARAGWIPADRLEPLRRMAGFRNVLVNGYAEVDKAKVREIVERHLGDLLDFVAAIRRRIG